MLKRVLLAIGALLAAGNLAVAVAIPTPPPVVHSSNWAGYVAVGNAGEFTGVSAEWRVPKANCSATPNAYASQWVGLDGFNDKTVEQLGVDAVCSYGEAEYVGWFEMYPAYPVASDLTIHPGDRMQATIVESNGEYLLAMKDLTTGKSEAGAVPCGSACERSSAEVISEAPYGEGVGVLPLTDFGSVQFSNVEFDSNGAYALKEIVQRQGKTLLQQPGPFSGNGFAITWKAEGE